MSNKIKKILITIIMQIYNRDLAIKYATEWWNKRNPLFYDFENLGGDCTNFISQCLFYGGFSMHYQEWFFSSLNSRSPSWTGVNEFYNYLITNKNQNFPQAKSVSIENVEDGDLVQLSQSQSNYHHTAIITKIADNKDYENIFITCHTMDALNKPISAFYPVKIRFLKIIN